MRGKKRPLDERANAVGIALIAGAEEASRQTGIPSRTILRWESSPEMAELGERNKETVAVEWWAGVQAYQRSIMRDVDSANLRDKVGAFAIMFEKLSLLRGDATARTETRSLVDDFDDHEAETLGELVRAELERRSIEETAEPAVEGAGPS